MPQYFEMACPSCGKGLKIRTEYSGRRLACKHCDNTFIARDPADASEPHISPWPDLASQENLPKIDGSRSDEHPAERQKDQEIARLRAELETRTRERDSAVRELADSKDGAVPLQATVQELK